MLKLCPVGRVRWGADPVVVVDVGIGSTVDPQMRSAEHRVRWSPYHSDGTGDDDGGGCVAALAASGHRGTKGSCAVSSSPGVYNIEPIEVSGSSRLLCQELYTKL